LFKQRWVCIVFEKIRYCIVYVLCESFLSAAWELSSTNISCYVLPFQILPDGKNLASETQSSSNERSLNNKWSVLHLVKHFLLGLLRFSLGSAV
jgi:hypothetical protein